MDFIITFCGSVAASMIRIIFANGLTGKPSSA